MNTEKLRRISLNDSCLGYMDCVSWWMRTKRDGLSKYNVYFDAVKDNINYQPSNFCTDGVIVNFEI